MLEYNKDGKIINGTLVYEGKNSTFYNNNEYSIYKDGNKITKTRYATKDGTKYVLFENPVEKESDAKYILGAAGMRALDSPLKTHYPLPK